MTKNWGMTIAALSLLALGQILAPQAARATETQSYAEAQARYLDTAEVYRGKARDLAAKKDGLEASQQAIVGDLVAVYGELAETKVALADAIGAQDWSREEGLEQKYYSLKAEEETLWDALEASK